MEDEKSRQSAEAKRRAPRQKRSQALVQSMLEATGKILEDEGAEALTTNHIAEVAGVSVGSLYQYFENKNAIVEALFLAEQERMVAERADWVRHAMPLSLEEMLRFFIQRIAAQHRRLYVMHTGLYAEFHKHTDVRRLADESRPVSPDGRHAIEIFLETWCLQHREEVRPDNLVYASFLMDRLGYEMMRVTVDERPEYLADPDYVEEMVLVLLSYLRR